MSMCILILFTNNNYKIHIGSNCKTTAASVG